MCRAGTRGVDGGLPIVSKSAVGIRVYGNCSWPGVVEGSIWKEELVRCYCSIEKRETVTTGSVTLLVRATLFWDVVREGGMMTTR
jgi:hypothetical protein